MKPRKRHLTAQIKPATRNAILDQLAGIADGIIRDRQLALEVVVAGSAYIAAVNRPWWRRLLGLR